MTQLWKSIRLICFSRWKSIQPFKRSIYHSKNTMIIPTIRIKMIMRRWGGKSPNRIISFNFVWLRSRRRSMRSTTNHDWLFMVVILKTNSSKGSGIESKIKNELIKPWEPMDFVWILTGNLKPSFSFDHYLFFIKFC